MKSMLLHRLHSSGSSIPDQYFPCWCRFKRSTHLICSEELMSSELKRRVITSLNISCWCQIGWQKRLQEAFNSVSEHILKGGLIMSSDVDRMPKFGLSVLNAIEHISETNTLLEESTLSENAAPSYWPLVMSKKLLFTFAWWTCIESPGYSCRAEFCEVPNTVDISWASWVLEFLL